MKVFGVNHWVGKAVPPHLQGRGPFDLSLADIEELTKHYDVMIKRVSTPGDADAFCIYLDDRGRTFGQR